jgi:nickel-type superoxide dismutase maturation protease
MMAEQGELKEIDIVSLLLWMLRLRKRLRVTGASMFPLLKSGDEILINPRAYKKELPQPGQLVVARHPYRSDLKIVKRVTSVSDDGVCYLQGDNPAESTNSDSFGRVPLKHIVGQVTGRF